MSGQLKHTGDDFPEVLPLNGEGLAAQYEQAGKSQNTEDAYRKAVEHFRDVCHGHLPSTEKAIVEYITKCAGHYAVNTIKLRLAGLSRWHTKIGFPDPTKGDRVKAVLKGIATVHNKPERQATPLAFDYLKQMVQHQELAMVKARSVGDITAYKRCSRDVALLLIGFWRGFRSDELSRLQVEHITVYKGARMEIYLPYSKTDKEAKGRKYTAFALTELCPVQAYCRWVEDAGIAKGPVFRSIDRWGHFAEKGITGKSIGPLLNSMAEAAGLDVHLSTHSLRHGFANWAAQEGWDIHSVMSYVGWANYESSKRYIPPKYSFGKLGLDSSKASLSPASVPTVLDGATIVAEGEFHRDN